MQGAITEWPKCRYLPCMDAQMSCTRMEPRLCTTNPCQSVDRILTRVTILHCPMHFAEIELVVEVGALEITCALQVEVVNDEQLLEVVRRLYKRDAGWRPDS